MAYTVKLWDKTEIILNNEQANSIKQAKLHGVKAVSINGNIYDTSAIAQIVKGGVIPIDESMQIESGNTDRRADIDGEGYKKFQEMKKKLKRRSSKSS